MKAHMYRKYYSYNDMPKPVPHSPAKPPIEVCEKSSAVKKEDKSHTGILSRLESDDMILIAVLLILFLDNCDDKLLIAAIAFLLFVNEG